MRAAWSCAAVLAGVLLAEPATAREPYALASIELGRLLDQLESKADRLLHEYRVSLRRADRYLPRGAELELWNELDYIEGELNRLSHGHGRMPALELERDLRLFLARVDRSRRVMARVPTSRRVATHWNDLDDSLVELSREVSFFSRRNARYVPPPGLDGEPRDPAVGFSRRQIERLRAWIYEAEDRSNRLKTHLREDVARHVRRPPPETILEELETTDLRGAVFSFEKRMDELLAAYQRRGHLGLVPEMEAALAAARTLSRHVHLDPVSELLARDWAESIPALTGLALLYELPPVVSPE